MSDTDSSDSYDPHLEPDFDSDCESESGRDSESDQGSGSGLPPRGSSSVSDASVSDVSVSNASASNASASSSEVERISWVDHPHSANQPTPVNETCTQCPPTSAFIKRPLFGFQRAVVQAARDLIERTGLPIIESGRFCETRSLLLAEPPGSGKTIMIAAIAASFHEQRLYPSYIPRGVPIFCKMIPERVLLPALVIVANSVFEQFRREVVHNTTLRVLPLRDNIEKRLAPYFETITLSNGVEHSPIDGLDVILVRNGTTHGTHPLAAISSVLSDKAPGAVFGLIVFDDVDKLNLPPTAKVCGVKVQNYVPPSLFTVYATASLPDERTPNFKKIAGSPVRDICTSVRLRTTLRLSCDKTFRERTQKMPHPHFFRPAHDIRNPHRAVIQLMGALANSRELVEMLNANALQEASESAGVEGGTTLEIFERLFQKKFHEYEQTRVEEMYLHAVLVHSPLQIDPDMLKKRASGSGGSQLQPHTQHTQHQTPPPPREIPRLVLEKWIAESATDPDFKLLLYLPEDANTETLLTNVRAFNRLRARLTVVRGRLTRVSKDINRIKTNVSAANCCVCKLGNDEDLDDFSDDDDEDDVFSAALKKKGKGLGISAGANFNVGMLVVVKCCGKAICENCLATLRPKVQDKTKKGEEKGLDGKTVNGDCPNCRRIICISSSDSSKVDILPISREATHGLRDAEVKLERMLEHKMLEGAGGGSASDNASTGSSTGSTGSTDTGSDKGKNKVADKIAGLQGAAIEFDSKTQALEFILSDACSYNSFDRHHPLIQNLLGGTELNAEDFQAQQLPLDQRKFIIFANYEGSLNEVMGVVRGSGKQFDKVGGDPSHIQKMVERFWLPNDNPGSLQVLVLNSIRYCAGLNLQCATHMVAFHRIRDPSIETQVYGRAQRLGRTSPLAIYSLLYDNE